MRLEGAQMKGIQGMKLEVLSGALSPSTSSFCKEIAHHFNLSLACRCTAIVYLDSLGKQLNSLRR